MGERMLAQGAGVAAVFVRTAKLIRWATTITAVVAWLATVAHWGSATTGVVRGRAIRWYAQKLLNGITILLWATSTFPSAVHALTMASQLQPKTHLILHWEYTHPS